ncbi:DUF397 domain-containing protein [Actinomycetospora sp. NBRC 106378]|uniref:DUF397 domain-containing protein n=1 Tax=Actinomycetospora sp. NBRC 106378 TaxID=3032208 RepID=UPI0024A06287|nr:DUF397 domain-containing protein [Actinomycetospora sp. NBRC 106378]GLZ54201.1 hypothetical protein Acsp07_38180 [Actinomycetospora sp. NBRC 106378]
MLDLDGQQPLEWLKARASAAAGMCVEVAPYGDGVALRHSLTPEDGAILYSHDEFAAFLDGAKRGEFDHLVDMPRQRGASRES